MITQIFRLAILIALQGIFAARPALAEIASHGKGQADSAFANAKTAEKPALEEIEPEISQTISQIQEKIDFFGNYRAPAAAITERKGQILRELEKLKGQIVARLNCNAPLNAAEIAVVDKFNHMVASAPSKKATIGRKYWLDATSKPLIMKEDLVPHLIFYPDMNPAKVPLATENEAFVFTSFRGGIAAVFNPTGCNIETLDSFRSGVAMAYNPRTKRVETKSVFKTGVAAVYNPLLQKVEWKESFRSGASGAYNPNKGIVEWSTAFRSGSASVYNPSLRQVQSTSAFRSGVAGFYDPTTRKPYWSESFRTGNALVSLRFGAMTTESSSFPGDADSDDD